MSRPTCTMEFASCASRAVYCVLIFVLFLQPPTLVVSAGLATCPSPIFGKIGSARSGSCICSFSQAGISLSCTQVSDSILHEMLNSVDQATVESFKIENSDLKQLPSLANMKNTLRYFRCKNCGLKGSQLPCTTFKGFKKLRLMDLSDNPLESLCSSLFSNMLQDTGEEDPPATTPAEPQTVKINLSNTKLKRIPKALFTMPVADPPAAGMDKIVTLDLSKNKLTQPMEPGVFTELTALEELSLSEMNLEDFQETWFSGDAPPAEAATTAPGVRRSLSIINIKPLRAAVASKRQKRQEPAAEATGPGGALKKLSLSHNAIRTMRKEDLKLFAKTLEALDLSYNRLQALPSKFLGEFIALTDVSFANNQLKTIPADLFTGDATKVVSALSLANNSPLQAIPVGLFSYANELKELSLANLPKLKTLSQEIFSGMDLDVIDLRGTKLTNKEAILQQAQADEGPVEINVVINTV